MSAGLEDEGGGGCDVPEFAVHGDGAVGDACGDLGGLDGGGAEDANLPGVLRHPPRDERGQRAVGFEEVAGEHDHAAVGEGGLGDGGGEVVGPHAFALGCGVGDVSGDVVDDAEDGDSLVEQADADSEVAEVADEVVGSVDGVDDPDSAHGVADLHGDAEAGVVLLADDAVGGEPGLEGADDVGLDLAVRDGDGLLGGCDVGFGLACDVAVVLEGDGRGGFGEVNDEGEVGGESHGVPYFESLEGSAGWRMIRAKDRPPALGSKVAVRT